MEQAAFLEQHVFTDLKNINDGFDKEDVHYFSESDFETVLKRLEHFGIGVYTIEPWLDGKVYDLSGHGDHNKKATDARWYKKAFLTFRTRQTGLAYAATYKVSNKLLAREIL
jgi:hypothetical protein